MGALDIIVILFLAATFTVGVGMMIAGAIILTSSKGHMDGRDSNRFRSIKQRLGK